MIPYTLSNLDFNTKKSYFLKLLLLFTTFAFTQTGEVSVVTSNAGMKLVVNGEDFMINGMNWD